MRVTWSLVLCAVLFAQPEVGWGLRGLINLYGPSGSGAGMALTNGPQEEMESVGPLTCPVACAQMALCLAYALRPNQHAPNLFTCRLFNQTDLIPLDQAPDDLRAFNYFILISSQTIEPEAEPEVEPEVEPGPPLTAVRDPLGVAPPRPPPPDNKPEAEASPDVQPEATPTLLQLNGSTYYASYRVQGGRIVREELVTQAQAQANCSGMGLRLVAIETAEEQAVVEEAIRLTSEGGQTGLSRSFQEFWTAGLCPAVGPCVWGPDATRPIDQQAYTNWLTAGAPSAVSVDTMYRNQWRRRAGDAKVWYLCDDGALNSTLLRTTQAPTTRTQPRTTTRGPRSTTTDGHRDHNH